MSIIPIIRGMTALAVTFCLFMFGTGEINPLNWSTFIRSCAAVFGGLVGFVAMVSA